MLGKSFVRNHRRRQSISSRLLLRVPVLTICVIACGEPGTSGPSTSARDSAGVQIVDNFRDLWTADDSWSVAPAPALEIAGSPDQPLFNVIGAVRLSNGSIVLANQGSSQLLFFDSTGEFVGATGRLGDGPGEFRDISGVAYCEPDSIIVYDRRTLRASMLNIDGGFVRSFVPPSLERNGVWPQTVECSRDGTRLVVGWGQNPSRTAGPSRERRLVPVLVMRPGSDLPVELGPFPGTETQDWVDASGTGWWGPAPFGKQTSIGLVDSSVYVAPGDAHEIRQYNTSGALERIIRWSAARERIMTEDVDAFKRAFLDTLPADRRLQVESLLPSLELPELMPAHGKVLGDGSGHFWVEEYAAYGGSASAWRVFDRDGRMLGEVTIPEHIDVRQIGDDFILGVVKDEMGVERVLLYRLSR